MHSMRGTTVVATRKKQKALYAHIHKPMLNDVISEWLRTSLQWWRFFGSKTHFDVQEVAGQITLQNVG